MTGDSSAVHDWFWFHVQDGGTKDKLTGLNATEFAHDLEFINS